MTSKKLLNIIEFIFAVIGFPFYLVAKAIGLKVKDVALDKLDVWTFSHTLATVIIGAFLTRFTHYPFAAVCALVIMLLWEYIIDGLGLGDRNGFSSTDVGADIFGALLWYLIGWWII